MSIRALIATLCVTVIAGALYFVKSPFVDSGWVEHRCFATVR